MPDWKHPTDAGLEVDTRPDPHAPRTVHDGRGMWTVEMWSEQCNGWLPAGYITDNYAPCEQWRNWPAECNPRRAGFKCILLNGDWNKPQVFELFRDCQLWIVNNNPFGIAPF